MNNPYQPPSSVFEDLRRNPGGSAHDRRWQFVLLILLCMLLIPVFCFSAFNGFTKPPKYPEDLVIPISVHNIMHITAACLCVLSLILTIRRNIVWAWSVLAMVCVGYSGIAVVFTFT